MAASAAASVVWLTVGVIMTLTPGRDSTLASGFADLDFNSDFFVVTGAFDCTDTGFALDKAFAFGVAATAAPLAATLAVDCSTLPFGDATFVFASGFTTFFSTVFTVFAAAVLAFVAASVGDDFAGFFIAFAIGSTTKWVRLFEARFTLRSAS